MRENEKTQCYEHIMRIIHLIPRNEAMGEACFLTMADFLTISTAPCISGFWKCWI